MVLRIRELLHLTTLEGLVVAVWIALPLGLEDDVFVENATLQC